jgi:hypothetical protein
MPPTIDQPLAANDSLSTNDALNGEREDLKTPLPSEWRTAADLTDITLYQAAISPPCVKIRAVFAFYKVPFTKHNGKKPNSPYKKIPVVDIGKDGHQINDSFIIVKSLAPILQGRPLTEEEIQLEEMNT